MKKNGRPKKYTKQWADDNANKIPELMKEGESIAQVCIALGMSKDSFYKCRKLSAKFSDALKKGLTQTESWWIDLGTKGAMGEIPINATVWIFNMKNRFKWRDNPKDNIKINHDDCKLDSERIQKIKLLCLSGEMDLQDGLLALTLIEKAISQELEEALESVRVHNRKELKEIS